MWVKSITLSNIKCFRDEKIPFTGYNKTGTRAKPYSWITLLGENGVGKSTLLQALALLLAGPEGAKELLPRPTGWVRDSSIPGKISTVLYQQKGDIGVFPSKNKKTIFPYAYFITGDKPVKVKVGKVQEIYTEPALIEEPSENLSWLRINAFSSHTKGWFAVGYGAFRRLTRISQAPNPGLEPLKRSSNFNTQFHEDKPLSTFEQWMSHLEFRKMKQDKKAEKMQDIGKKVIEKLLPGDTKISGITIDGEIKFLVNGRKVSTIALSDGYRSVIALAGDLIWRLLQAFPDLEDPTQAFGVVLIDELDIHLHPSWQRQIPIWLRQIFPNLQFIVATHSPLVAAGGGEDALTLRLELVNGEVEVKQVPNISAYDADYILRSPAFGLESTHSPETQAKINRYHQLRKNIDHLIEEEKKEYENLRQFMKEAQPIGGLPEPGSLTARIDAFLEDILP